MAQNPTKQATETQAVIDKEQAALEFAKKLASQTIHDPDGKTSKRKPRSYSTPTKESVETSLKNPTSNEKNLRDASIYLYQVNTRYRNLINYYANLPCWTYIITPLSYNPDKAKKESLKKQYVKVCNLLESMGIEKMMREVVTTAVREGAYYGVIWGGDGNSFILQKLDPDYCQIVSISDGGVFQFKYDMSKVPEGDVSTYYPPAFTTMYQDYLQSGERYQLVPPEISVCFKGDPSIVDYSVPSFAGVMPSLFAIENVKSLVEGATELSNYKLLAGKIPVDADGVPLITYETMMQYYNHIANNVGERVGVALSPFDLKDYSFEQSGTIAQIDNVSRANENFFAEAGTSALLHGATNDTSGVTKLAIKVDEAYAFGLMYQAEKIINRLLKLMPGTAKFKIHFLDVSQFNRDEKIEEYRAAMNYGIGKLEFLALMGIHQFDVLGEHYVEQSILDINNLFTPMHTASTQSASESSQEKSGRSPSDDGDLTEQGEATRDNDTNENR